MQEFPSNSNEPRKIRPDEPEKKPNLKVIQGGVVRRKKPLGVRIRDMFVAEDGRGVLESVIGDILVPAMKDMVADSVSQGIERMIFGDARPVRRRESRPSSFGSSNHTNYTRYSSNNRRDDRSSSMNRRPRASHDFDDIIIASRVEADDVLNNLSNILERYEFVSVRDLYELVGEAFHHTDEKWGWTNLRDASVRRVSNGYLLNLPRPEAIDD